MFTGEISSIINLKEADVDSVPLCRLQIKTKLSERNDHMEGTQLEECGAWIFCPRALLSSRALKMYLASF